MSARKDSLVNIGPRPAVNDDTLADRVRSMVVPYKGLSTYGGIPSLEPKPNDHRHLGLELTRLTIPRRVYTQSHMDVVAESVLDAFQRRDQTRGLRMVYEPMELR